MNHQSIERHGEDSFTLGSTDLIYPDHATQGGGGGVQRQESCKFRVSLVQNEFIGSTSSLVRPCVKIEHKRADDVEQ